VAPAAVSASRAAASRRACSNALYSDWASHGRCSYTSRLSTTTCMTGKTPVSAKYRSSSRRGSANSRRTRPSPNPRGTRGVYSASIWPSASMPASVAPGGMGSISTPGGGSCASLATRPGACSPPVRYRTEVTGNPCRSAIIPRIQTLAVSWYSATPTTPPASPAGSAAPLAAPT
jgi:hypothetical protein